MGTFSFSPTAEAGGTFISFHLGFWDQAELSPGKYILVFQQDTPDRYFTQVVNLVDGVTSPTFGAQQTVVSSPSAPQQLFVLSLSASKAVIIYHNAADGKLTMRVLNIDGSDAITVGTSAGFTLTNQPLRRFAQTSTRVKHFDAVAIDASNFYLWHNSSASSGTTWKLSKFNVSGDTITQSGTTVNSKTLMGGSWNHETTFTANYTWKISKALTAGEFIIQSSRSVGIIDGSFTKISDLSDSTLAVDGIAFEIATDEYVNIQPDQSMHYNKSGVWGPPIDFSGPDAGDVKDAFRLTDTHFGFIQVDGNTAEYIQFVRKLNDDIWEHQTNSVSELGFDIFTTVTTNADWWNGFLHSGETGEMVYTIDASNFAIFHAPNATTLEFTVINQAV